MNMKDNTHSLSPPTQKSVEEASPNQIVQLENDLETLIINAQAEHAKLYKSQFTLDMYETCGFNAFHRYAERLGIVRYSNELIDGFIAEVRNQFDNHMFTTAVFSIRYKSAIAIRQFHDTGRINPIERKPRDTRDPSSQFSSTISEFCDWLSSKRGVSSSSISRIKSGIRQFVFTIEDMGVDSVSEITRPVIRDSIADLSMRSPKSMSNILCYLRSYLSFLYEKNMLVEDLVSSIPPVAASRRPIRQGYSSSELEKLTSCPDRNTSTGKRDYAVFQLAIQTGLRAVDIAHMQLQDIDWNKSEINIVQHKSGKAICIPVEPIAGNAIVDYLLNARPVIESNYLFLSANAPYTHLKNSGILAIASRYMKKAGIETNKTLRKGFHSFRRSFGANLLQSETPLELLSEIIGHSSINSTVPYISANEEGLRECSIGLKGIEIKEGSLK